jgi:hypothetical protein
MNTSAWYFMPLFNFYIMVDWSGAGSRRGNRTDSIWIALGGTEDEEPKTESPFFTDQRARSGTPFRVFGHGSVGSQTLAGIPRVHELRFDPEFAARSAVWPFETGWATKVKWPPGLALALCVP